MKVFYSRVSTAEQNEARQMQMNGNGTGSVSGFDYVLTDKVSGSVPLFDRPKGKQIRKLIDDGSLTHLEVHSIDRLGRDTLDVLSVWQELTDAGVRVVCRNPNFQNITEDGKPDMFSELLLNILSTMASFEKRMTKIRQMEGIAAAKLRHVYSGRAVNTKESKEKFLAKPKSRMIRRLLNSGYTMAEISNLCRCSFTTITKVKKLLYSSAEA